MVAVQTSPQPHAIALETAAAGILALLLEVREERVKDDHGAKKSEILLTDVGLSVDDLALLTGKKPDTIRKTLERARKK
jgi:DNA-directed RNA polymerase specialized sigma24 family protein